MTVFLVAAMDPIEIASSDGDSDSDLDWNLDEIRSMYDQIPPDSTASVNHGDTPLTVDNARSVLTVDGESSREPPTGASTSSGISAKPSSTSHWVLPPSCENSTSASLADNNKPSRKVPSRAAAHNGSSLNRSHQTMAGHHRPSGENGGSSQMREAFSAQQKSTHGIGYPTQIERGNDNKLIMYQTSTSTSQHASSVDPVFRSMTGEERGVEYDERLIFQAALQDLNQPKVEEELPEGLMTVSLLRHQKIALAWMLRKENRSTHCAGGILADDQGLGKTISMAALILMQKLVQSKTKPEFVSQQTTEAFNLDDDEDNDVTVLDQDKQVGESNDIKLLPEARTSRREFKSLRPQAGTLVVCPASVLRQWARELDEKVAPGASLNVLIYHGSNRIKDPDELAAYDVVLTTYALVANEVPKQPVVNEDDDDPKNGKRNGLFDETSSNKEKNKTTNARKRRKKGKRRIDISDVDLDSGALARVRWFRVILDEAQTIKNHRTQVARACCSLKAKVRWCLSGTPIQNSIDELFSYFRFLRYEPYTTYKSFCGALKHPISINSVQGYKKLYAVLRTVMLRRTKGSVVDGKPIITLPSKTINLTKVEFSVEERAYYRRLEAESRSQFKAYAAAGTLGQNYANILLMLLRLRQACDHPLLVKGFTSDSIERYSSEMAASLPRDMLINLLKHLQTSSAICGLCKDPPEDAIVTMCGHVFCYQCVSEYLRGDDNVCPSHKCIEQLGPDFVFSKATLRSCISDDRGDNPSSSFKYEKSRVLQRDYVSSKIKAAMEILISHCKSNSPSSQLHGVISSSQGEELSDSGGACLDAQIEAPRKAIVFSQWIGMLDLVEMALLRTDLQYRKLDGTMTLSARDKAVREFNTDPEVTVMLMSLKAGNLGLNMVAASHVILLDLWWNPTTEDQAIDRAHRIGQTRPVTVSRITIRDTVEDRILALQEEKRRMVASAFGEESGGTGSRLTVEDLRYLFMGN
ncbi:helicase-like transcription factor CHR28 [Heracleum sosnowskyi]|uniref:Helicase-like transcription factor CHR28 n=1 Tax=Heracleum sosnowskyi TaxID=360622 RepID=A0AAD8ILK1_9APIA|nr:helicase-like transcription factor CHR28 [Heracleum sosnowskyi]